MQKIQTILFDLDGTLSRSGEGIYNSIKYALDKADYPPLNDEQLRSCIGPPLDESFMRLLQIDPIEARRLQMIFREYYETKGIWQCSTYDNVSELLEKLHKAGKTMMICTGKPQHSAIKVLEILKINGYISDLIGLSRDGKYFDKAEAMRVLIERNKEKGPFVMVGDRLHDIEAAKANRVLSVGVLWGYGSQEELEQYGADRLVKDAEELYSVLMSL